jgi:hypothetical protein
MTDFEDYRWEDHVPRAGGWKINLAAGLLALGLIYAALPGADGLAPMAASASVAPTEPMGQPVKGWWAYCAGASADYADS